MSLEPLEAESEEVPSKKTRSFLSHLITILQDHLELAELEWKYERGQVQRRIAAWAIAALLILVAVVLLQIALISALMSQGLSLGVVCLTLTVVYGVIAGGIAFLFGRRDPKAGDPFQGTKQELLRNLQWIQKLFS